MDERPVIPGGYALQPRKLFNSELWEEKSLLLRCLWTYLWGQANHKDHNGIKRGQILTSLPELQKVLAHKVGYRLIKPSKSKLWRSCEWLRDARMIATTKTTRGLVISVCNYDFYQDPRNYERNGERNNGETTAKRHRHTIHKNGKKEKNVKRAAFVPPTKEEVIEYSKKIGYNLAADQFINSYEQKGWMVGKNKMQSWQAAVRNWKANGWGRLPQERVM